LDGASRATPSALERARKSRDEAVQNVAKARTASDVQKLAAAEKKQDDAEKQYSQLAGYASLDVPALESARDIAKAEREGLLEARRAALFDLRNSAESAFAEGLRFNTVLAMDRSLKDFRLNLANVLPSRKDDSETTASGSLLSDLHSVKYAVLWPLFPDHWVAWSLAHHAKVLARQFGGVTVRAVEDLWRGLMPSESKRNDSVINL
jgi:hypothetical protein